jgi:hypothetical protein
MKKIARAKEKKKISLSRMLRALASAVRFEGVDIKIKKFQII